MKRIFKNKIYWLSMLTALILLCVSVIYRDINSGKTYMFIELLYDSNLKNLINYEITLEQIIFQSDTGYLWMFCPIIVGIPCIINKKNERFVMFRMGKKKYIYLKYLSNLLASGMVIAFSYVIYALIAMCLFDSYIWNILVLKKILSVFCFGIYSVIPAIVLTDFLENKYLILCIPFVINYFMYMFASNVLPMKIYEYVYPGKFQLIFLNDKNSIINCMTYLAILVILCGIMKKIMLERRCDSGS